MHENETKTVAHSEKKAVLFEKSDEMNTWVMLFVSHFRSNAKNLKMGDCFAYAVQRKGLVHKIVESGFYFRSVIYAAEFPNDSSFLEFRNSSGYYHPSSYG